MNLSRPVNHHISSRGVEDQYLGLRVSASGELPCQLACFESTWLITTGKLFLPGVVMAGVREAGTNMVRI